ncbi:N-acetyltransferase [Streptomyces albofaciens JCM 4342]|uniref:GNAT family N-acetyltransferase n=1 Tax=Streptomyces albofaciens TaxID=66866 RepID=UPI00123BEF31|nr:GNAT family N-acetyltransferase [Streptomyces albofaciens]KAA6213092.1 N-acetyltransferase [Streptomyces albofaciens JCM 4342]
MSDLQTDRLVLHPLTAAEAARLVARTPADGDRWAPGYPTDGDVESATDFLNHCAATGDPQPFGDYEIRRLADGLVIGSLGFNRPPAPDGSVTIGYGLVPAARGHGYAAEALRELLRLARERGVTCVKGDADLGNTASQRVMTAAGMRPAGEDERVKYFEISWPATDGDTAGDTAGPPGRSAAGNGSTGP